MCSYLFWTLSKTPESAKDHGFEEDIVEIECIFSRSDSHNRDRYPAPSTRNSCSRSCRTSLPKVLVLRLTDGSDNRSRNDFFFIEVTSSDERFYETKLIVLIVDHELRIISRCSIKDRRKNIRRVECPTRGKPMDRTDSYSSYPTEFLSGLSRISFAALFVKLPRGCSRSHSAILYKCRYTLRQGMVFLLRLLRGSKVVRQVIDGKLLWWIEHVKMEDFMTIFLSNRVYLFYSFCNNISEKKSKIGILPKDIRYSWGPLIFSVHGRESLFLSGFHNFSLLFLIEVAIYFFTGKTSDY